MYIVCLACSPQSVSTIALQEYTGRGDNCKRGTEGYWCQPRLSHLWGQYSAYFRCSSEIDRTVPAGCKITFVQVLSRHGARSPTANAAIRYKATIDKLRHATAFTGPAAFLQTYEYEMPEDALTEFGRQQMIDSGTEFVESYPRLSSEFDPFVRASGSPRVVESAEKWTKAFYRAKKHGQDERTTASHRLVVIPESPGYNNTLTHGLCSTFEATHIAEKAQHEFAEGFTPSIYCRLNRLMPGADLDQDDVIRLMELCPFSTVAELGSHIAPFCDLFTNDEFRSYNHFASLGKYYGYGNGHRLGPTQGVGFVNELIARLTRAPIQDWTSTNHTLNSEFKTFPLNSSIYADFTHDNVMTSIMFALGLYSETPPLSNHTVQDLHATGGYSAAHTVPFAGRLYLEKMACTGHSQELVRVLVNGRVIPLRSCNGMDKLGRCTLDDFVSSLSFARSGGRWDECKMT